MRLLDVLFDTIKITNGMYIDLSHVQAQPKIKFSIPHNKYYTLLMADPDAPSRKNPKYKYWLHWLVMNNNDEIIGFSPSNPPPKSGKHRYYIYLFEQPNKIENLPQSNEYGRKNFSIDNFINKYKLSLVSGVMYETENKT